MQAAQSAAGANPPDAISIRWTANRADTNQAVVEVLLPKRAAVEKLRRSNWKPDQWQRLLSVYAEQGDLAADIGLPAMSGNYRIEAQGVRFEPRFPLEPGMKYRAVFCPAELPDGSSLPPITAFYQAPARSTESSTIVTQIYPSAPTLPENLLKFYLHFSAPMSRGGIYEHIHLRGENGQDIELPFLEIGEELWNLEMTRLTLFIDPGRIKREVKPLEDVGPALEQGKRFTLVIDRKWRDAAGKLLKEDFRKQFTVGPPDRDSPNPAAWKIQAPKAATREPVTIRFPEPMDHALAQRVIRVADSGGNIMSGQKTLDDQERLWTFVPTSKWRRGSYQFLVQTIIEDLAGNNIGKPFEVDLFEGVQRRLTNSTVKLSFEVR